MYFLPLLSQFKNNVLQFSPRQFPQAVTHLRPFLRQKYWIFKRKLHRTNLSRVSSAAAMSLMTGVSVVPSSLSLNVD